MTVQQAVQVYLKQLQESGYSYSERAHKARILNRWFIIALALHHPTVPSKLHALPFSILLEASSEKVKHFLESFQKEGASIKYLNLKVFLEAHPELFDSAKSVLRLLAGRLALKDISERVGKQMLKYLETLSVDRAASYSRAFFIFCYEQGWLTWNSHYPHRAATDRVFEANFLGAGIWPDRLRKYLKYLEEERNLSAGGIDYYARKLKVFTEWLEGRRCTDVQKATVREFIQYKREHGVKETTLSKFL